MTRELTWHMVCEQIDEIVAADLASGEIDKDDEDSWDEYAHEWADGSEWVIYYSNSRKLWADGAVDDYEDEVVGLVERDADIDQRITVAVYLAVRARIMDAIREQVADLADADE